MAESDLQLHKLPKSQKGNRLKGGAGGGAAAGQAKNKLNNQNQMHLSFSNALEFQQLLASKHGTGNGNTGTGNFPASNLLTAAAKAQGNNSNPLTQALTQLQQGLTHCKGTKGKGKKGGKTSATAGDEAAAPVGKKDDFHAGSFLVNESGQLEGGDALVAALLGNPGLATNSNQAQMLLQQLSNLNGQNNDCDGVRLDAEQLAASQMAMLNMLMAGGSAGNQGNACGKDGAQSSAAPNAMITGLDVAHNAIINAFNASNAGDLAQKTPRTKRRRSAPQGDPSMFNSTVSPVKFSRPRSAPGGANVVVSQHFFPDVTNFTASSSSSELKSPSHAVTMVTSASTKSPVAVPGAAGNQFEGMPPLSAAPCVTTVTSSIPQVISSTTCVGAQPTTATSTVTIPQQQQQQLQNSVITQEQLNQLQLSMFYPTAHLTGAQLLELQQQLQQQLLNQQQQLFQGQNQLVQQGDDLQQQQMGLLQQAMMNPMLLQQQLAQFQQQAGGLSVEILTQLQLSQMAMGGQLPDQALAQIVQANALQQQNVAEKDLQQQQQQAGNGEHNTSVEENPESMEGNPDNSMEIGQQQANSDENNKPAETIATVSPEKSAACESSRPAEITAGKVTTPSRSRQGEYICRMFTDHLRSTRKGDVFTGVCLSTRRCGVRSPPLPRRWPGK